MLYETNSPYFLYYSGKQQQSISLEDIVVGFESDDPSFFTYTWVRASNALYWSHLEYTKEIALSLHWDYVEGSNKYAKIEGSELARLFKRGVIKRHTQEKLSFGYEWQKYKTTVLFENISSPPSSFYGVAAHRPDWKNCVADIIDMLTGLLLIALLSCLRIEFSLLFLMEAIFSMPSSLLQAWCVKEKGRTLGMKIVSLYVLTSQGQKLTFSQALSRQSDINRWNRRRKFSYAKVSLSPYGAVKWVRDNQCVVTKQFPN
jgi:hypothetical protein